MIVPKLFKLVMDVRQTNMVEIGDEATVMVVSLTFIKIQVTRGLSK